MLSPFPALPQNIEEFYEPGCDIDSLENLLENAEKEYRVQLLVKISQQYYLNQEYSEALTWAKEAEQQAIQTGYSRGLQYAYDLLGYIELRKDNPATVLKNWQNALDLINWNSIRAEDDRLFFQFALYQWKYNRDISHAKEYLNLLSSRLDKILDCQTLTNRYYNLVMCFNQAGAYREEWVASQKMYHHITNCEHSPEDYRGSFIIPFSHQGKFLNTHGDYSGALERYLQCLEDIPKLALALPHENDLRARIFNSISRNYLDWGRYNEALVYQRKALASHNDFKVQGTNYGDRIDLSNYLEGTGYAHLMLENFDSALYYFHLSRNIRIEINDELGIAMSDDGIGETYLILGNYFAALEYLDSALARKQEYFRWFKDFSKDKSTPSLRHQTVIESLSLTKMLLGRLYRDWEKYDLALQYLNDALGDVLITGDLYGQALSRKELGITYVLMKENEKARTFFLEALENIDTMGNPGERGRVLYELGQVALKEGNEGEFLVFSNESDSLFELSGLGKDRALVMKELGRYWVKKGEWGKALEMLTFAFNLAEEKGLKRITMECSESLADIYEYQNKLGLAWFYIKRYNQLRSELFDLEALKKINQVDAIYHLGQKEEELQSIALEKELQDLRMEQNRYLMASLGALLIVLVLFFILIIRNSRIKSQQQAMLLERRLLRSQMNPHFIFNALTNIQEAVFKNDPFKASKYLSHFSGLIRLTLESTREEYVPLQMEIDLIRNYLELQKLRHGHKFEYHIMVGDSIDPDNLRIPPMLAQPFIENAIEHGLKHKAGPGRIDILFTAQNGTLHFMVQDDGIGREQAARLAAGNDKLHRSMSSQITLERLQLLNRKSRQKDPLRITDLYDAHGQPAGTRVEFEIPVT